jgi:hypothetical protein
MKKSSFVALALIVLVSFLPSRYGQAFSLTTFTKDAYPLPGGIVIDSSPTIADVDGDGLEEVIIGTTARDAKNKTFDRPTLLAVMSGNGNILASQDAGAPITSAPAVGDIDGDGQVEIVVGLGGDPNNKAHHGGIAVYRYSENRLTRIWRFRTHDWNGDGYKDSVRSSPALCDVDNDGDLEIAFGSWDRRIYLIDHQGNSLWEDPYGYGAGYYNADTIWSSAACADLNGDGEQEVIIGTDIHGGGILPDGTRPEDGGYLYIFDKKGNVLVRRYIPESVYSSPAVGDLNQDGNLEIVVGTSYYYWKLNSPPPPPRVYAFDTSRVFEDLSYDRSDKLPYLPGWPRSTAYPGYSSPALVDLDGDSDLEIVIGSGKPTGASNACSASATDPDCYGAIYAWHHDGHRVDGFPMWPTEFNGKNSFVRSSPTVADIDQDGQLEILFSMLWSVIVVGHDGQQEGYLRTSYSLHASPAIGDTNGDGKVEVWIGGSEYDNQSRGYMWRFESEVSELGDAPWPMFHRDAQNSGSAPSLPRLNVSPSPLYVMHDYGSGDSASAQISIQNVGGGELTWKLDDCSDMVMTSPVQGTISSSDTAEVEISTTNYAIGTYDLGYVVIVAESEGEAVENSPFEIPIKLYVGDVHKTFLPLVAKGD